MTDPHAAPAPTGPDPPTGLRFEPPTGPVHVPSLTGADRDDLMSDLRGWTSALVARFAIEARLLPPCWEAHNGMVEALAALRDHERDSFGQTARPSAAVDWLRALREVEALLTEMTARTGCTALEHRTPRPAWPGTPPATRHTPPV